MQCSRLSHAGLILEEGASALVIDVGDFTSEQELHAALKSTREIAALVITHEHADHWAAQHVHSIRTHSPSAPIFTTAATARALADHGIAEEVQVVSEGDQVQVADFNLHFYGHQHEQLHSSIAIIDNIGVRVNDLLAWGGDSLVRAPFSSDVLGVPIGSPWSTIAQVMDFVLDCTPRRAFLTHDGMLSEKGKALFTSRVQWCLEQYGGELLTLPHILRDKGTKASI